MPTYSDADLVDAVRVAHDLLRCDEESPISYREYVLVAGAKELAPGEIVSARLGEGDWHGTLVRCGLEDS